MAERLPKGDKGPGYLDELREIQNQYRELSDLHDRQKVYAEQLSEIVRALQREADATIPLRPTILGEDCSAAYLVSDAVVVMFDIHREMTSRPLSKFSPAVVVSVIEECASELGRQLAKKREAESEKVETLERVLREISKAHSPYRRREDSQPELERLEPPVERAERTPPMTVTERREAPPPVERREAPAPVERRSVQPPVERREAPPAVERRAAPPIEKREASVIEKREVEQSKQEQVEMAPQARSSSSFVFKGSFGQSKDSEASY